MCLLSETRTSLENPQTPLSFPAEWLLDIFNSGRTDSGQGGFLVPAAFVLDVEATTEAFLDLDFLAQFFPTTFRRYANLMSLADVRRRNMAEASFTGN